MNYFDVAVIGSGPAGASTAFHLAKSGISTVIIEKETLPRYKTCGGGFVFKGRKNLPFEIDEIVEREFRKIDFHLGKNLHFTTEREDPTITMVMRDSFDNFITEKAKELGAKVLDGHKLTGLRFEEDLICVETSQGEFTAKFVIAADGVLSPTAKLAGWTTETRKLIPAMEYEVEVSAEDFERLSKDVRFDIDAIPHGYAWSFPKKHHLSIGVASGRKAGVNLKEHYKNYLKTLGVTEVVSESKHGFQIPVTPRTDGFTQKGVFLIGDAAGFADPVTAEGISNAIYSGKLAAESIIEAKMDKTLAESLYAEKLEVKLIPELKTGIWLSKWFYEKKRLRNLVFRKFSGRLGDAMIDFLHGEREYPKDIKKAINQKIKQALFSAK